MPAWARPARWSRSRTARSPAGAGRRNPTSCSRAWRATLGVPLDKVHVIWATGPGSYGRNDADDAPWMPPCWRRRSASRCGCNTCATRAPAGTRRARPRSTRRARRSTPRARSSPTSSSARASRASTSTPTAAIRTTRSPGRPCGVALKSGDGFGVPAESYAFANKRTVVGDDPAAARPLLAAAHRRTCAIRSGRRSISPASSSSTRWRRRSNADPIEFRLRHIKEPRDIAVIKAAAEKAELGHAALAAQGPDRQQGVRPRHRLLAAQRHARRGDRARSISTARPARSGRASSPSRTIAGRSSIRTGWRNASRATSCRASAARCGRK